ncbi:unnamed protein product [Lampetra fluviatilis]
MAGGVASTTAQRSPTRGSRGATLATHVSRGRRGIRVAGFVTRRADRTIRASAVSEWSTRCARSMCGGAESVPSLTSALPRASRQSHRQGSNTDWTPHSSGANEDSARSPRTYAARVCEWGSREGVRLVASTSEVVRDARRSCARPQPQGSGGCGARSERGPVPSRDPGPHLPGHRES